MKKPIKKSPVKKQILKRKTERLERENNLIKFIDCDFCQNWAKLPIKKYIGEDFVVNLCEKCICKVNSNGGKRRE